MLNRNNIIVSQQIILPISTIFNNSGNIAIGHKEMNADRGKFEKS